MIGAMAPFRDTVTTVDDLRRLYREPSALVQRKKVGGIDGAARRFIGASPFCLVATADGQGRCDVSPRGGPAGFVKVLDERRLALPDLNGNNLIDTLSNVVAGGQAGLLFVVPGRDETVRVNGRAWVTTDPEVLGLWDGALRRPTCALGVEAEEVFLHCAKSFRRGGVWDPATWGGLEGFDTCEVFIDAVGLDATAEAVRAQLEAGYEAQLAADRP